MAFASPQELSRVKTATTASNLVITAKPTLAKGSILQPVFLDSYQLISQLTDLGSLSSAFSIVILVK